MRAVLKLLFVLLVLSGTSRPAEAEFRVKAGKWQVTSTTSMPMMPEPQTMTETECITEEQTDPLAMMKENQACTIKDRSMSGDTVTWKMECPVDGGSPAVAEGKMTGSGEAISGEMQMKMQMGDQSMTVKTSWKGKRLGDCD